MREKINTSKIVSFVFLIVAIFLFFIAINTYNSVFVNQENIAFCDAKITNIQVEYDIEGEMEYVVFVSYLDKFNQEHKDIYLGEYDLSFKLGDTIKIKYQIDNPEEISWYYNDVILVAVIAGFSAISLIVSLSVYFTAINKKKKMERMLQTGDRVYAIIDRVYQDTSISINGYYPYVRLVCIYDNFSNEKYTFTSKRFKNEDYNIIVGDYIRVYLDWNKNPRKNYYVELEPFKKYKSYE